MRTAGGRPTSSSRAMDAAIRFPGLTNAWTMPIKTRIDMLSTGIKTPVGIKIAGPDLARLQEIGTQVEAVIRRVPGTVSAYAERMVGGNYIDVNIDRDEIGRYGLTDRRRAGRRQQRDRRDERDDHRRGPRALPDQRPLSARAPGRRRQLRAILVSTPAGQHIPLGQLAHLEFHKGPPGIKSENGRPNTWIYVDLRGIDVGTYVARARRAVAEAIARGR